MNIELSRVSALEAERTPASTSQQVTSNPVQPPNQEMASGGDGDDDAFKKCVTSPLCAGCGGCFLFIFFFIFLPVSFSGVEYYEIALKYSTTSGVVDPESFTHGNHFIGPFSSFHKFPATAQSFESKSIAVFTKASGGGNGGATVNLDISFQYTLIPGKLFDLYQKTGYDFEDIIQTYATSAIKNVAAQYTDVDYLERRIQLEQIFRAAVDEKLEEVYAKVVGFQLRKIVFASAFIKTKLDTAIQHIKTTQEEYKKTAAVVRANSGSQSQEIQQQGTLLLQKGEATGTLLKARAASTALSTVETARNMGLANLYDALGVTASKDKASLDYLLMIQEKISLTGSDAPAKVYVDFAAANTFM